MKMSKRWFTVCLMLTLIFGFSHAGLADEKRIPVKVPGKTTLPLRVIARPFSNIYKAADESSGFVKENVPTFQSYFVYTRPDVKVSDVAASGWYEVGSDNRGKNILGWMKASDVMEWKQAMCLAYEHPSGRKPVMMFKELAALRDIVKAESDARVKKAETFYQQIESGNIPENFPVISVEPKDAIDITKEFYLLPILEHAEVEIEGREGRLLKMAAATQKERGEIGKKPAPPVSDMDAADKKISKNIKVDLVYVVDMTNSMDPYIKATTEAIKEISRRVTQNNEIAKGIRFGLWGYRDSMDISGIEFNTKNFTPELQDVDTFEKTLSTAKGATVGSEGYEEDLFSGVDKAMRETKWTDNALSIIVLVGDAPGHEAGHKWNASGQSADTLRIFADDHKKYFFSMHIKTKGAEKYWETAENQYKTLSQNKGLTGASSYFPIPSDEMDEFARVAKTFSSQLVALFEADKQCPTTSGTAATAPAVSVPETETEKEVAAMVEEMYKAAKVEWLGSVKGAPAPRDIIAWVTDKDMIDPSVPSLDVRVLINKKQLDSLRTVLQDIMTAGSRGLIGGEKFFEALQAIPAVAVRSGDQLKNAKTLAETDLIPEFMQGLPYKSKIMNMSDEIWSNWGVEQQEDFLAEINTKIQLYATVHNEPEGWIALNKGDDPDEFVYPLSLTSLP